MWVNWMVWFRGSFITAIRAVGPSSTLGVNGRFLDLAMGWVGVQGRFQWQCSYNNYSISRTKRYQ